MKTNGQSSSAARWVDVHPKATAAASRRPAAPPADDVVTLAVMVLKLAARVEQLESERLAPVAELAPRGLGILILAFGFYLEFGIWSFCYEGLC